jgi:hypothetical protein
MTDRLISLRQAKEAIERVKALRASLPGDVFSVLEATKRVATYIGEQIDIALSPATNTPPGVPTRDDGPYTKERRANGDAGVPCANGVGGVPMFKRGGKGKA